jgi:CHRD domain
MTSTTRTAFAFIASATLIATTATAQPAAQGGKRFTVQLTGAAECNNAGACGLGDPDGSGTAVITVNKGQGRVCWDIDVTGVDPIAAAHIHIGFAGIAFPNNIVVHLDADSGCTTTVMPGGAPLSDALLDALMKARQAFYVNVHNASFPAGALRGQLG